MLYIVTTKQASTAAEDKPTTNVDVTTIDITTTPAVVTTMEPFVTEVETVVMTEATTKVDGNTNTITMTFVFYLRVNCFTKLT